MIVPNFGFEVGEQFASGREPNRPPALYSNLATLRARSGPTASTANLNFVYTTSSCNTSGCKDPSNVLLADVAAVGAALLLAVLASVVAVALLLYAEEPAELYARMRYW